MAKKHTDPKSDMPDFPELQQHGFKVHAIPQHIAPTVVRGRRDFYKVGLVIGNMAMQYGDKAVELKGRTLFFVNPHVPHTVVRRGGKISGYACLFTEAFIAGRERADILQHSPLANPGMTPAISLDPRQSAFVESLFRKMIAVQEGSYGHKSDVLRHCLELLLHEAQSLQPAPDIAHRSGATRISHLFLDLLERQFPIDNPAQPLRLRTPQDFAAGLSVHVNYLNRAMKEATGKPTSTHIAERILAEAKALLIYTDWSVADIAYGLGFEYPTYFNNFYKKMTGATPLSLRRAKV